jgi:hypothetical protein
VVQPDPERLQVGFLDEGPHDEGPFACSALGALLQAAGELPEQRAQVGHGPPDQGSSGPLYSSRMVKRVGAVLARREETIAGAMEAGADGFLAKDASSRQVAGPSAPLVEGTASVVAEADLDPRTVPATCNSEPLFSTV